MRKIIGLIMVGAACIALIGMTVNACGWESVFYSFFVMAMAGIMIAGMKLIKGD